MTGACTVACVPPTPLMVAFALDQVLGAGSAADLLNQLRVFVQQLLELSLSHLRLFLQTVHNGGSDEAMLQGGEAILRILMNKRTSTNLVLLK